MAGVITEIAIECGVSEQAVRAWCRRNHVAKDAKGSFAISEMALRSVTDRHKVQELTEENTRLRSQVPSMKKRLEEAQRQQRLEQENRRLRDENYYLQSELQEERSFTERLTDGIGRMLDFLEEHLPERLRPLLEKARELLPDPEIGQQQEQQQHQRGMGGMEL